MPVTVTEATAAGGFTDLVVDGLGAVTNHERLHLDPKEAADLFAALGRALGGLGREHSNEYELADLAGEEGRGDFLHIGSGDEGGPLLAEMAYLTVNDGSCVYLASDQATAAAAALIFHASR